jgi:hypothetical protein
MATKKLTPVTRKPAPVGDIDIDEEVVTPKAKVVKTKSTASNDSKPEVTQKEVLEELKKQTEYLHRVDWKLWMLMNMVRIIGEENGYTFKFGGMDTKENE